MAAPALKCLDLFRADGSPLPGLVLTHARRPPDGLDEAAVVREAAALEKVDYVFFRRFKDERSSQVGAFVVDNSDERLSQNDLALLHRDVWRQGVAPLLYVAWPTRVDILACARGPDFWYRGDSEYRPAEKIDLDTLASRAADANAALHVTRRRFSGLRLADGTFWDDPLNRKLADFEKAAHQALIRAVVEADRELDGDNSPVLRRLLLLVVLIKYLEDRGVFPPDWFGRFCKGATSFLQVLQEGEPTEVRRLLASLERRFNGDVFALPEEQHRELSRQDLRRFAELVEARTLRRQRYLWEQFSFKHLPVEVVSSLYQRFVKGGHGVVYTPPLLASLLLDHVMPFKGLNGRERILDPACGSGVFLVGAFRRLVNVWRSQNGWKDPSVSDLKAILQSSIFGVDIDAGSVDLTVFSLSLAVCDELKPNVIWKDLRFEPFRGRNILEGDFFRDASDSGQGPCPHWPARFDVVVGNPPFESELTEPAAHAAKAAEAKRGKLPDRQLGYLFLEKALEILQPKGKVCLLQPAGLLYNRNATDCWRRILGSHHVSTVLDFVSIRGLYDEADTKSVAILAHEGPPSPDGWIRHLTFRRTFSVYQRIGFELDHYDRHRVPQRLAERDPFVWRINLLGGGRLQEISERLRSLRTLAQYVQERGWDYGEGFIAARKGRREPAPFLTGKRFLPTDALTESGIDESKVQTVEETHFRSAYTESRYSSPLLLIKELDSLPMAFWDKGFLSYRDKIVGVHAEPQDRQRLEALYGALKGKRRLYRFCCMLNGSQVLVGKATAILKQDIDALPCPDDPSELELSFWEEALQDDVLDRVGDLIRLGQNSPLFQQSASRDELSAYAELFCRMLGSVYENLRAHPPLYLDGLICQPFYFGSEPRVEWLTDASAEHLNRLIYVESHETLRTVRVLRFYVENVILLVKPDRLRYWIASTAIRDADETLHDLRAQGY